MLVLCFYAHGLSCWFVTWLLILRVLENIYNLYLNQNTRWKLVSKSKVRFVFCLVNLVAKVQIYNWSSNWQLIDNFILIYWGIGVECYCWMTFIIDWKEANHFHESEVWWNITLAISFYSSFTLFLYSKFWYKNTKSIYLFEFLHTILIMYYFFSINLL